MPTEQEPNTKDEATRAKYGVWVVLAGLFVILIAFFVAVSEYTSAADVSTALAPVVGVVGTLVGAYFGVQVGSAGKQSAENARARAEHESKALAAAMEPERAAEVFRSLR